MRQSHEKFIDENYILQKCNELLKNAGVQRFPVEPKILASFQDIRRIIEKPMQKAGILKPLKSGGAIVFLRKPDSIKRKRFTCCHEISHTFFPDYQLKPQQRVGQEVGEYQKGDQVEYLCDFGASELLMPSFLFFPLLIQKGFKVSTLLQLSDEFISSLEATALKMVKQNPQKTAVVIWEEKYKPSQYPQATAPTLPGLENYKPQEKLRVRFGYGMEQAGHIPKDKSLKETEGIIKNSFLENIALAGMEKIDFGNFKIECNVQTLPLQYRDKKRILALLFTK